LIGAFWKGGIGTKFNLINRGAGEVFFSALRLFFMGGISLKNLAKKIMDVVGGVNFFLRGVGYFIIVIVVVVICYLVFTFNKMMYGSPALIEKSRQKAWTYIAEKYPNYIVSSVEVCYDTEHDVYVVVYHDERSGDRRELIFDYKSEDVAIEDNFVGGIRTLTNVIIHTRSIEHELKTRIESEVYSNCGLTVYLEEYYYLDKQDLKDEDFSNAPIYCIIHIPPEEIPKIELAEIVLKTAEVVKNSGFVVKELRFDYNNETYLIWNDDMLTMTPEELAQYIKD